MITIRKGTEAYNKLMYELKSAHGDIYSRYKRPSNIKVRTYNDIITTYNTFYDENNYLFYQDPKN